MLILDKEQLKQMLIEMMKNNELSLSVNGYSSDYSYTITVSLNIDGEPYLQEEVCLDK